MMLRRLSMAALCAACIAVAHAAAPALDLPADVVQGRLVLGRVPPGTRVTLGARDVRVAPDGRIAIGIGRDEAGPVALALTLPDGTRTTHRMQVRRGDWQVERVDGVPQATVDPPPEIAARIAREQAAVAAVRSRDDARTDFAAGFTLPAKGRVSGRFGSQRIYNGTPRSPHSGLDIAAAKGTPLHAPAAGIVTYAAPDLYLTGGTVVIDHGHGVSSVFLHLSRIDVKVGQRIAQGAVFGAVGATGRATGPHMHWGMNWFDVRVDPAPLVGL